MEPLFLRFWGAKFWGVFWGAVCRLVTNVPVKPTKRKKSPRSFEIGDFLVRLTGFEPATSRVGVLHSIQLSYSRKFWGAFWEKCKITNKLIKTKHFAKYRLKLF